MNFFELNTKLAEIAAPPGMRIGMQAPVQRGIRLGAGKGPGPSQEPSQGPKMYTVNEPEKARDSLVKALLQAMHPEQTEREVVEMLFHAIGGRHGYPVEVTDMERYIVLRQDKKYGAIKNIHQIPDE